MKVLLAVFSPVAAWTLPAVWTERRRRDFPQHQFVDAWTETEVRQHLPFVDVAFTPYIFRDQVASLTRLKWIQTSAAGVGTMMSPELVASPIVITNARGIRAPNVIVTPHVSGAMADYWTPLVALFADNLRRFESGRPLLNLVDKARGY
jgi:phosphoglycerate dehydrogenase-like enzyme